MHLKKRVLVTGGAGFIGSHLCERLLKEGCEVLCLDNLFTGEFKNIQHLVGQSGFEFIRHDIIQPILLEVDEVYNLACPASPVHYQFNPVKTVKTSVMGAINMLGLAKRVKARILQASTSEVYGDPQVHPQTEEYWGHVNPSNPLLLRRGKRCRDLFFDYHRQHHLPIKVARIFNTYGPRMHPEDGRVVSNFIVQALRGQALTLYGEGGQTRSFCFVDDMVEGLIRLMASPEEFTGPVNLGNPVETSVRELLSESASSPVRAPPWSSFPFLRTIPASGSRTSPSPEGSSPGSPRSVSTKAWNGRSPTSEPFWSDLLRAFFPRRVRGGDSLCRESLERPASLFCEGGVPTGVHEGRRGGETHQGPLLLHCFRPGKLNQSFLSRTCRLFAEGEKGWPGLLRRFSERRPRLVAIVGPFPGERFLQGGTLNLDIRVDMIAETLTASPMMMGGTLSVLQLVRGNCVRYSRNSS